MRGHRKSLGGFVADTYILRGACGCCALRRPDVSFIFEDIDGDGKREVVATEFFVNHRVGAVFAVGRACRYIPAADEAVRLVLLK